MRYDYFGNTSLRVKNLLYNFEVQLLLFEELFSHCDENDIWANDSSLQVRYLELLKQHNLLESKHKTTHLGTKDARVKSAPLEDYGLINRKEKKITPQGYELLELIKTQSYKIYNDFLQIDLISLFFLKASLQINNNSLFGQYLEVFKAFNGSLDIETFKLLPLVNHFASTSAFIEVIKNKSVFTYLLEKDIDFKQNLNMFLNDLKANTLQSYYFKTAKGEKTAVCIVRVLQEIFLPFKMSNDTTFLLKLLDSKDYSEFKNLYLPYILKSKKKKEKIENLKEFCNGETELFGRKFFCSIFEARIVANLNDYLDLNRRYLNLTGIFEFYKDRVVTNIMFSIVLKHPNLNEILNTIKQSPISKNLLNDCFNNKEFKKYFENLGIKQPQDIKQCKINSDKQKLTNLLNTSLKKENVIELLTLFNDRKNDEKILERFPSTQANIPTIFEYIIAVAWCHIDENIERIFEANLSLDSALLPKSHAVGGNADFVYVYDNHHLMIEVTLTEKTNQRRAEMESVSRHLGNLLLSLEKHTQQQSYGIFIAPYLDKNVLNDFRSRIHCYFENEKGYVEGMKILPLSTQDIVKILQSNLNYKALLPHFKAMLADKQNWGSKWYEQSIQAFIDEL